MPFGSLLAFFASSVSNPSTEATSVQRQLHISAYIAVGSPGKRHPLGNVPPTSAFSPSSFLWLWRVRPSSVATHSCLSLMPMPFARS